mgnify:CR=1 FL=1
MPYTLELVDVTTREMERGYVKGRYYTPRKARIHFWIEDYNPLAEMESGYRYNRPHIMYRKELMPKVWEKLFCHYEPGDGPKIVWSQKAGCSCRCSPGFIIQDWNYKEDINATYRFREDT